MASMVERVKITFSFYSAVILAAGFSMVMVGCSSRTTPPAFSAPATESAPASASPQESKTPTNAAPTSLEMFNFSLDRG